jgi:hypothetical protein
MDPIMLCPKCGKRRVPVVTFSGRTDLQCISCDDPAVKWAESPLIAPEKPIVAEPACLPLSRAPGFGPALRSTRDRPRSHASRK